MDKINIEVKFNEKIYCNQIELLYNLAYSKEIKYNKGSNYLGLILLIIAFAFLYRGFNLFGLWILLSSLINFVPHYLKLYKRKSILKKLDREKKETIAFYNENPITQWLFSESSFVYTDSNNEINLTWNEFKTYTIVDETIILFTNQDIPFILSSIEVGSDYFNSIIELVKKKIPLSKTN